ncbi:cell division ATP-binding protein FtsE [Micrococcales bacterium 31B]|nr:cell division ATP-binding protein FtsE [Micrococcales bacterium 31B]
MIRFENVTKTYPRGTKPALNDVTLELERGAFTFLVGASGSGKSTFLRLALKEDKPTSGKVFVAGKDLGRIPGWKVPILRRSLGMVFQDFRLLPNKTAYENVAFALQVIGKNSRIIKSTVPEVLELVGLAGKEKRLPHQLSGGEQQRVAIARAFVNRPQILLADEPTGNLDPVTSLGIMKVLERINQTGTTIVMATHDTEIVNRMRKRVVELEGGVITRDQDQGLYSPERDDSTDITGSHAFLDGESEDFEKAHRFTRNMSPAKVGKVGKSARGLRGARSAKGAEPVPAAADQSAAASEESTTPDADEKKAKDAL